MARPELRALTAALLALTMGGCDRLGHPPSGASVTVKLPPPRPHVAKPAFSFAHPSKG